MPSSCRRWGEAGVTTLVDACPRRARRRGRGTDDSRVAVAWTDGRDGPHRRDGAGVAGRAGCCGWCGGAATGQDSDAVYAEAAMRPSTAAASAGRISNIQPSPYGSELMSSGEASSASLTAVTSPSRGAKTSLTDFVDSTSPQESPGDTVSPTAGSDTYTTSPRASCAKEVIPTRTTPSSPTRTYSRSLMSLLARR